MARPPREVGAAFPRKPAPSKRERLIMHGTRQPVSAASLALVFGAYKRGTLGVTWAGNPGKHHRLQIDRE
jgi:hypothetical protein